MLAACKCVADVAGILPRNLPRVCDGGGGALGAADDWDDGAGAERNLPRRGAAAGAFSVDDMIVCFYYLGLGWLQSRIEWECGMRGKDDVAGAGATWNML